MAFIRCCGITRKGVRCSILATNRLTDEGDRLIGAPLLHGGNYGRLHARPFSAFPADFDGPAVVLLLELETPGVDVASDKISKAQTQGLARSRLRLNPDNAMTLGLFVFD